MCVDVKALFALYVSRVSVPTFWAHESDVRVGSMGKLLHGNTTTTTAICLSFLLLFFYCARRQMGAGAVSHRILTIASHSFVHRGVNCAPARCVWRIQYIGLVC